MRAPRIRNLIQAAILSSLAALMVAGFLVLGGLGAGDPAEARGDNCRRLSLLRCQPRYQTSSTFDFSTSFSTSTSSAQGN